MSQYTVMYTVRALMCIAARLQGRKFSRGKRGIIRFCLGDGSVFLSYFNGIEVGI